MKASERQTICPVCGKSVSADYLKHHIASQARVERRSNLQVEKVHNNYWYQHWYQEKKPDIIK